LCVLGVLEIADALADDLAVVIILEQPADRRTLDRPRARQRRQKLPGGERLRAILPADDDERAVPAHSSFAMFVIRLDES
jgi:hypothetical protein